VSWRSAIAAGLGSAIEYYDFQLYAVLAVSISPLFFPNQSPETALLSTLLIFGGAFVVRPLGGIFFGWLGDRHGRRTALLVTVIGMGFATACLGLLPGYLTLGVLAPYLLLALRFAQGFFAGGEVTGAATYIAESVPTERRGFFGAWLLRRIQPGDGDLRADHGDRSRRAVQRDPRRSRWRPGDGASRCCCRCR